MKQITFLILILLFTSSTLLAQDFKPFDASREGLFLNNEPYYSDLKYYVSLRFQEVQISGGDEKYFSYPSLRIPYNRTNDHPDHAWYGSAIDINTVQGKAIFNFVTPDSIVRQIPVFYQSNVGDKWSFELIQGIQDTALVISASVWRWKGLTDSIRIIEFTDHAFGSGSYRFVLSKNYGIIEMPNLQYLSSKIIPVTIAGLITPRVGVQDYNTMQALRMETGDILHTKSLYQNFDVSSYLKQFIKSECLEVISETDSSVVRKMHIESLEQNELNADWIYKNDTIIELYNYPHILGFADEYQVEKQEHTMYFTNLLKYPQSTIIDVCSPWAYVRGMDFFYDCGSFLNWIEYYHLPVYVNNKDTTSGTALNFSEILESKSTLFAEAKIYPLPATHYINVDFNNPLQFIDFTLSDIFGRSLKADYSRSGNGIIINLSNLPVGIYI